MANEKNISSIEGLITQNKKDYGKDIKEKSTEFMNAFVRVV